MQRTHVFRVIGGCEQHICKRPTAKCKCQGLTARLFIFRAFLSSKIYDKTRMALRPVPNVNVQTLPASKLLHGLKKSDLWGALQPQEQEQIRALANDQGVKLSSKFIKAAVAQNCDC